VLVRLVVDPETVVEHTPSEIIPLVIVQTCRSETPRTPAITMMRLRTSSTPVCAGASSISTATVSFSSAHDEQRAARV